jgi:peptidoglycan/LPS O-acetylase OafA/YrhL
LSYVAVTVLFACAVAVLVHLRIEMPLTRWVRRRLAV